MCGCSWGRRPGSVADLQSDDSFVVLCAAFAVNGSLHQTNNQSAAEAMWVYACTHSGCSFACIFHNHIHLRFFVSVSDRRQNRWIGPTQSHSGKEHMQTPGLRVKDDCVNKFVSHCSLMPKTLPKTLSTVLQLKYCGFEVIFWSALVVNYAFNCDVFRHLVLHPIGLLFQMYF